MAIFPCFKLLHRKFRFEMSPFFFEDDYFPDENELNNIPDNDADDEDIEVVEFEKERVGEALLQLEDLGPDDEIWTLSLPKHVS
jgi:hypothetical protein